MCLSVPARIESVKGDEAVVSVGGAESVTNVSMIENPEPGDYVLVHAGFAIQKLSEEEAQESLRTFDEYESLNKMLDNEEDVTGKRIV